MRGISFQVTATVVVEEAVAEAVAEAAEGAAEEADTKTEEEGDEAITGTTIGTHQLKEEEDMVETGMVNTRRRIEEATIEAMIDSNNRRMMRGTTRGTIPGTRS